MVKTLTAKVGVKLDAKEMVNDTLFALFSSKEGMQDMIDWTSEAMPAQERKTFLETFKTILEDVIKALDHFLKTGSFNSAERAALEMEKDQAKAMRKMVLDAMDVAIENRDKAAENPTDSPDVRKSIKVNDLADKLNYDEYRRVKRWIDNNDKPTFIAKRGETKGDKVLRLDNKLVYTDFKKDDFGISKIVSAEYQDSEMITVALDTYTDYEEGVVNEQQLCEIIESFFGAENFREYTSKGRTAGERYDRPTKRNKGRSDAYHAEREQNRKRVFVKDGVVVEDSRKSVKVTDARNSFKEYGEASPYTDSLEEVEVVSTILSKANQALGGIKSVKESSLNRISRSVIKKYKSNVEVEELSKNIFQAFSQMAENKLENNYESVMDYMLNIGDEVIANSQLKDPDSERVYNEARKNLQSYNIKLTETDKEELKNAYGTLIKGMGTLKKHGINLSKDGHTF